MSQQPAIGKDKLLHFGVSLAIAFALFAAGVPVVLAGIITIVVGIAKELIDVNVRKAHDIEEGLNDILFDAFGVVVFFLAVSLLFKDVAAQ